MIAIKAFLTHDADLCTPRASSSLVRSNWLYGTVPRTVVQLTSLAFAHIQNNFFSGDLLPVAILAPQLTGGAFDFNRCGGAPKMSQKVPSPSQSASTARPRIPRSQV